jgi:hypothetical protein
MTHTQFDQELEERLIRYCRIDTQADEKSTTSPSTAIQFDLLKLLVEELKEIGAQDVTLTDYGAVLATIPATVDDQRAGDRLSGARGHRAGLPRQRRQAHRPPRLSTAVRSSCPTTRRRCFRRSSRPTWRTRSATTS